MRAWDEPELVPHRTGEGSLVKFQRSNQSENRFSQFLILADADDGGGGLGIGVVGAQQSVLLFEYGV